MLPQALYAHIRELRPGIEAADGPQPKPSKGPAAADAGERALVEARIYLTGALFKMDHHPMEVYPPLHALHLPGA